MSTSAELFDRLAERYDEHFAVPHRALYDELAWEWVCQLLPDRPGLVVDAGCGVGRWAARLVEAGHRVVGIEEAPAMAAAARERAALLGGRFEVVEQSMAEAVLPPASADVVLALGSLQYVDDPEPVVARLAGWLRPGGALAVLVDSLVGLSVELLRRGDLDGAVAVAESRKGLWRQGGAAAELHLLDRATLTDLMRRAGLRDVRAHGLLVSASVVGVPALIDDLAANPDRTRSREHRLSALAALADLGKHVLVTGRQV